MASFGSLKSRIFDGDQRKQQYQAHIRRLNAYDRHKKFLKDYEKDDKDSSWEQRLVKRYYEKLFKEYCITDMWHYRVARCAEKLHYKRRKEEEKLERREKDEFEMERDKFRSDRDTD